MTESEYLSFPFQRFTIADDRFHIVRGLIFKPSLLWAAKFR